MGRGCLGRHSALAANSEAPSVAADLRRYGCAPAPGSAYEGPGAPRAIHRLSRGPSVPRRPVAPPPPASIRSGAGTEHWRRYEASPRRLVVGSGTRPSRPAAMPRSALPVTAGRPRSSPTRPTAGRLAPRASVDHGHRCSIVHQNRRARRFIAHRNWEHIRRQRTLRPLHVAEKLYGRGALRRVQGGLAPNSPNHHAAISRDPARSRRTTPRPAAIANRTSPKRGTTKSRRDVWLMRAAIMVSSADLSE